MCLRNLAFKYLYRWLGIYFKEEYVLSDHVSASIISSKTVISGNQAVTVDDVTQDADGENQSDMGDDTTKTKKKEPGKYLLCL